MPIFFQQDIDETTRLAVWKIEEEEDFFLQHVPLQREITHPHKRLQHLAGRYLLQYLFPDFPINLIKIADTRKPYLEDEAYHFSISHCSDYAAVIVSRDKRVGVDIEVPTPKVQKIMHKFLHEEEKRMVDGRWSVVKAFDKPQAFGDRQDKEAVDYVKLTLMWSAKEAVFKWWSYGNVDFSEMIRLDDFDMKQGGTMVGRFVSPEKVYPLTLHYLLFEQANLAWLVAC
jgi:4'-phosphopantetheinyl transferase EntD